MDVLVAAELMEAGRAVMRGFVTPDRTILVASTHRVLATVEKVVPGDGRSASAPVLAELRAAAHKAVLRDLERVLHDGTYLHTDGADRVSFDAVRTVPDDRSPAGAPAVAAADDRPTLVSANARVVRWDDAGGSLRLRLEGHVPVELELAGTGLGGCSLVADGMSVRGEPTGAGNVRFRFEQDDTGDARLDCPA